MKTDTIGATIDVTLLSNGVAIDLSAVTTKELIVIRGDQSRLVKTATFVTTGTDGKLRWTTAAGDLTVPGEYRVEAHIAYGGGDEFWSVTGTVPVDGHL